MKTGFEFLRVILEPFMPALYFYTRRDLKRLINRSQKNQFQLLDVGGRKSPYTIGLKAAVTIIDLPRENDIQSQLNLGITENTINILKKTRSNIKAVIIGDIINNDFPDASFDGIVSIEVIEHVEMDEIFLRQIYRVLKKGGWVYLTTPNGDYIKNTNPDHKRHYHKAELDSLLAKVFDDYSSWYGIKTGNYRYRGLKALDPRKPFNIITIFINNFFSNLESRNLKNISRRTAHLFAIARKS